MVTFRDWITSSYPSDRILAEGQPASTEPVNVAATDPREELLYLIEEHTKAKETSRKISLLDIPSQLAKIGLEVLLWPVVTLAVLGITVVMVSLKVLKKNVNITNVLGLWLLVFYPLPSIANRVRLIVMDLFGIIIPEISAKQRWCAFNKFPDGKSFSQFVIDLVKSFGPSQASNTGNVVTI